jgi:acyl carrier protein
VAPGEQQAQVNTESDIALLWAETLGHPEVRPEDDFFELGGDSLTAVQLVSRLRDQMGVTLSVVELLDQPTPRKLAAAVAAKASA